MPRKTRRVRRYGEGSLSYNKERNRWEGRFRGKSVVGLDEAEVHQKLDDLVKLALEGKPLRDSYTVTSWIDHWLDDIQPDQDLAEATVKGYRNNAKLYVKPYVGHIPLTKLTAADVSKMMNAMVKEGKAANTRRLGRTTLRRALEIAMRYEEVTGLTRNVVDRTDGPKIKGSTKPVNRLTAKQVKAVFKQAEGTYLEALAHFLFVMGSRSSETTSLRWSDINLDKRTVTFRRETVKTNASAATIPMSSSLVNILIEHRNRQEKRRIEDPNWNPNDFVFCSRKGTQLNRSNVLHWMYDLTEAAGVGRHNVHAARHTAGTLLLNDGVAMEVVRDNHRHSDLGITADIYTEVGPGLQRTAPDAMEKLLYGT